MLRRPTAVLTVLLASALGVTDALAAPPAGDVILFNPSASSTDPSVKTLVGRDKLAPAESRRILDAVFGGRYLTSEHQCQGVGPSLASSRQAGDFTPSVLEQARGSFTAPQRTQTLYLITDGECGATHADNWGSITLAVLEAGAVVAGTIIDGGSSIRRVVDIDGDGRNEVVLTSGFANQGSVVESARLVRMETTGLTVIHDFGQIFTSNCDGGLEPRAQTISVVHAMTAPGAAATFRLEPRTERCAEP